MSEFDIEARRVIEALRSGIPSRAVGQYFSEARPQIMKKVSDTLEGICEGNASEGMVISGKYGEGKTHLLNTVFHMAHMNKMVVSYLTISKESPFDKLYLVYQKLIANTYLPGREQPGFTYVLDQITPNSPVASDLLLYTAKELETDKLYYVLGAYLNTEDQEEKFQLLSDLEGDFIPNPVLKKTYKRIFNRPVKFNTNFAKTKHSRDYLLFMSHLFKKLGYNGWVILIDEAELTGRLGKKARLNSYRNLSEFLMPAQELESVYTLVALSASYSEDVIEAKHEYQNLEETFPDSPEPYRSVLKMLENAEQLAPLTKAEVTDVISRIISFHEKAYGWTANVNSGLVIAETGSSGYLLRTKLRSAIEYLDQLYQYGDAGETQVDELESELYEEIPSLELLRED
jgi:hypothetical protein